MSECKDVEKKEKLFIYPICFGSLRYLAVALLYRLGPVTFFFNKINTFILQGCIKLIKSNSKDFYIVKNFFLICIKMLFFWTLYSLNYIFF